MPQYHVGQSPTSDSAFFLSIHRALHACGANYPSQERAISPAARTTFHLGGSISPAARTNYQGARQCPWVGRTSRASTRESPESPSTPQIRGGVKRAPLGHPCTPSCAVYFRSWYLLLRGTQKAFPTARALHLLGIRHQTHEQGA